MSTGAVARAERRAPTLACQAKAQAVARAVVLAFPAAAAVVARASGIMATCSLAAPGELALWAAQAVALLMALAQLRALVVPS
jgi:hypothetical protein